VCTGGGVEQCASEKPRVGGKRREKRSTGFETQKKALGTGWFNKKRRRKMAPILKSLSVRTKGRQAYFEDQENHTK